MLRISLPIWRTRSRASELANYNADVLAAGLLVSSYVIGSIPFSFLIVKLMTGADIRDVGSRNVGATNVARSFGKLPGIIALILDAAKGYVVVALAIWLTASPKWPLQPTSIHDPSTFQCC